MIRPFAIAALLTVPLLAVETPDEKKVDPLRPKPASGGSGKEPAEERLADLLRFTNGNQIDGQFSGMDSSGVVTWTRPDVAEPMAFQREKLRQIVLRDARPMSALGDPCHVTLVNGDRIPGKVVAADDDNFTLESTSAGTLILPRDSVSVIAPNPFGGRLIYAGPFDDKGWKIVHSDSPAFEPDPFAGNRLPQPKNEDGEDKPTWVHSGASWFSRGGSDAITLNAGMSDRSLLRFKVGWRSRLGIAVAFHADLEQPKRAEKKEGEEAAPPRPNFSGSQNLARLFGSGYVMNFQGGYARLQRTGFDDEGNPETEPIRVGNTSIRLPETGEAIFEIRCDRQEGTITVHINNEFAVQWNTTDEGEREVFKGEPRHVVYQAPGGGLGFQVQGNAAPIRISDIVVAEWNGMTDSARSMESDSRDITLLANGTDRFSGRVLSIRDNQVEIEASYGPLKVPLEDVGEIHFARSGRRKAGEAPASEITVHLKPVGRISGIPLSATTERIRLETRLAGKVDLDLAPAVVLEFQSGGGFLDDWDDAP